MILSHRSNTDETQIRWDLDVQTSISICVSSLAMFCLLFLPASIGTPELVRVFAEPAPTTIEAKILGKKKPLFADWSIPLPHSFVVGPLFAAGLRDRVL